MLSRFAAFVIWASVAASLVFWAARLLATPTPVPAHATLVSTATASKGDLARLFGRTAEAPAPVNDSEPAASTDTRYELVGVVAPRSAAARAEGLAVIAFDGKPARAYRVGTAVDGELVLLAVHSRGASLGAAGQAPQVNLELPLVPPSSTSSVPAMAAVPAAPDLPVPGQSLGGQVPMPQALPSTPPPLPPGVRRGGAARGPAPQ
jgi:general secretion pathway protein C